MSRDTRLPKTFLASSVPMKNETKRTVPTMSRLSLMDFNFPTLSPKLVTHGYLLCRPVPRVNKRA